MKRYSVYWNNNVECNKVAEFATLDEAKAYCTENTKGYDEVCTGDNCFVLDENGDVAEFENTVYETEQFYCN